MQTHPHKFKRRAHLGFSLIEVLVAMVVLSLGLLGLAALQMTSLRFNQSSQMRTQATILASDIFDCMRANRDAAAIGQYATAFTAAPPGGATVHEQDLRNWKNRITGLLGATAQGEAAGPDAEGKYRVTIRWSDAGDINSGRTLQDFVYLARP
ncbi:hypothetical protein GCM10027046_12790 [Uliginosibacterium flavum]|uniref:Type IV pilus modification protein PilV n=1 Tax=Uliginosibacterium flavum TaxID=1396831 RepID=A0ABV2TNI4_9RHOO